MDYITITSKEIRELVQTNETKYYILITLAEAYNNMGFPQKYIIIRNKHDKKLYINVHTFQQASNTNLHKEFTFNLLTDDTLIIK